MIEFKHVDKVYPNGTKGLKDVNLTIDQGEFVAIIGLSGAGKSTLIRTINRMIDVTGGQLIVDGIDVMSLKGREMRRFRRKIGMIFQSYNRSCTPLRRWIKSAYWTRPTSAATSSPAASSSACPWRGR